MKGIIYKETASYIYTHEIIPVEIEQWFVVLSDGQCGTVFNFKSDAEKAGQRIAQIFHSRYIGVTYEKKVFYEIKHHRYRR